MARIEAWHGGILKGFRVGFRVWGLGLKVWGLGFEGFERFRV